MFQRPRGRWRTANNLKKKIYFVTLLFFYLINVYLFIWCCVLFFLPSPKFEAMFHQHCSAHRDVADWQGNLAKESYKPPWKLVLMAGEKTNSFIGQHVVMYFNGFVCKKCVGKGKPHYLQSRLFGTWRVLWRPQFHFFEFQAGPWSWSRIRYVNSGGNVDLETSQNIILGVV